MYKHFTFLKECSSSMELLGLRRMAAKLIPVEAAKYRF